MSSSKSRHERINNLEKEPSSDNSSKIIRENLIDAALIVVFGGALAYTLGWRYLYAYYSTFGLEISFLSFSIQQIMAAGWRSYGLVAIGLIIGYLIYRVTSQFTINIVKSKKISWGYYLFLGLFFASLTALLIGLVQYFLIYGTYLRVRFLIWLLLIIGLFWLSYSVGSTLVDLPTPRRRSRLTNVFTFFFPSRVVWLSIIAIGFLAIAMFGTSYNGVSYALRDKSSNSTLHNISIYTSEEIDIPHGLQLRQDYWFYDDLRLLISTDDMYFAFRLDEVDLGVAKLYGIPTDRVVSVSLRAWWYP